MDARTTTMEPGCSYGPSPAQERRKAAAAARMSTTRRRGVSLRCCCVAALVAATAVVASESVAPLLVRDLPPLLEARLQRRQQDETVSVILASPDAVPSPSQVIAAASDTVDTLPAAVNTVAVASEIVVAASTAAGAASTALTATPTSATATETSSGTSVESTAVPADYAMPQAFDSSLGTNFSSTACPSFFATFLASPRFQACLPFSLLLTTSSGFFEAERSPYGLLPHVLEASCQPDLYEDCRTLMGSLAAEIQQTDTCGPDIAERNALATEALNGFRTYEVSYHAGCQKNNATGRYCFAEAASQSTASEVYYYYLAEGTSLPSSTRTSCEACTQGLMNIYSRYATNATLPLSQTYANARSIAALACGPEFAPLVNAVKSAASLPILPSFLVAATAVIATLVLV